MSVVLGRAVARDNFGKELVNTKIDVRFSIIAGDPTGGTVVYQELHQNIITSKFGVFSLVIGHGVSSAIATYRELSQLQWNQSYHYLKVEVKFGNDFIDMGTMQFLAVPYALYAQKSLEPGPQGPKGETGSQGLQGVPGQKGDQGDPASDNQTLSFDGTNLSISLGNTSSTSTVNLSTLNVPRSLSIAGNNLSISGGNSIPLPDQIQDLSLDINNKLTLSKSTQSPVDLTKFLDDKQQLSFNSADSTLTITNGITPIDLSIFNQSLSFNPADNKLSISGNSHPVDLTILRDDADHDPVNEIQDINLTGNLLTIDKNASSVGVDLTKYLDNTDNQQLAYNSSTNVLTLTNGGSVNFGSMIAFRAKKNTSETEPTYMTDYDFVGSTIDYNDGGAYDNLTGIFNAPVAGIYTFNISYYATGTADTRILKIFLNGSQYEILNSGINPGSSITRQITMKLVAGDKVKVIINVGTGFETGTGSFSGFRVY